MADSFKNTPPAPEELGAMTEGYVKEALAGESQASQKYLAFAAKADDDGFANVGRLFRAVAYAEETHARNHLSVLGMIKSTLENLGTGHGGETFEIDEMYPAFRAVAKMQGNESADTSYRYALRAEEDHQAIYADAREKVKAGSDIDAAPIRVCPICGHTVIGDAPGECPRCGTTADHFVTF